jgi:hypothetical protein
MDVITADFQIKLLALFQRIFVDTEADDTVVSEKPHKTDQKTKFLDSIAGMCVAYLERERIDTDMESNFFHVKYSEIEYRMINASKDFKLFYLFEYTPNNPCQMPRVLYLCRMLMQFLVKISSKEDGAVENKNDLIKNASVAITDLYLNINPFVLYHVAGESLPMVIHHQKKNQTGPRDHVFNRIIDKLAPIEYPKLKCEGVKMACQKGEDLLLKLIELVELRRKDNDVYFSNRNIDTYINRRDFTPSNGITNAADNDKLAIFESTIPITFSTKIQVYLNEETKDTSRYMLQVGTSGQNMFIIDLLEIMSSNNDSKSTSPISNAHLTNMSWVERIEYLKKTFNVETELSKMKIISPTPITQRDVNIRIQNETPKFFILKSYGFGQYRSFYYSPKGQSLKRPHNEKEEATDDTQTRDTTKKFRI